MSSTTPTSAPPSKKTRGKERTEVMGDLPQTANEELRSKLMDFQIELQQEKGKVGPPPLYNDPLLIINWVVRAQNVDWLTAMVY